MRSFKDDTYEPRGPPRGARAPLVLSARRSSWSFCWEGDRGQFLHEGLCGGFGDSGDAAVEGRDRRRSLPSTSPAQSACRDFAQEAENASTRPQALSKEMTGFPTAQDREIHEAHGCKVIVALIETGLEAREQEKKQFFDLDASEQKRLKGDWPA